MEKRKDVLTEHHYRIAQFAKVFSHPVRVYITELLSKQTCCYSGDLSEELSIAKSTLSQHLKELKKVGIIQGEINGPRIKYCLNRKVWEEARLVLRSIASEKSN